MSIKKKMFLPLGAMILGSSVMFGFVNQASASRGCEYMEVTANNVNNSYQTISFQPHVDINNNNATHLKFGSRTIFIPDKVNSTNDN